MTPRKLGRARLRAGMALALGLVLAGCGSDTGKTESTKIAQNVVKALLARLGAGAPDAAAATAAMDDDQLAAAGRAGFAGPLILARIDGQGATTILGLYGENGAMRTYAAANEQSIILRDGILAGTRGLGSDLMSADTAATARLITSRQQGQADRILRYLDGEDRERPLPQHCTIRSGEAQSYDLAGVGFSGVQMLETCSGLGLTVENSYLVTAAGKIVASRQWIGPGVGYVVLQTVRP
jgi:hypothetical protein